MIFMMFMVVFTEVKAHSSFYVFCKTVCKAIQPGKLRVRCRDCKQGTLTLSRVRTVYAHTVYASVISLTPSINYLLCIEAYFLIQRCQFTSVFFLFGIQNTFRYN